MQVLGPCPLPVAPGVEGEGVVVVEEGYGRQQQEDSQHVEHIERMPIPLSAVLSLKKSEQTLFFSLVYSYLCPIKSK